MRVLRLLEQLDTLLVVLGLVVIQLRVFVDKVTRTSNTVKLTQAGEILHASRVSARQSDRGAGAAQVRKRMDSDVQGQMEA